MTSTIVPPVDLAPGMPSRVVTISATDVTEGGQSLEGQMVRFALSDTLDVSSGGDVIAKTQAEVVLDADGNGSIRLPVYDEDVQTWCGQDWAILVTATWGSQKAIRVPAGTSSIALSALPPVRPLRGREKLWAITGVSVSVSEGSAAGGTASLSGGVLDFQLTIPRGDWYRGRITSGSVDDFHGTAGQGYHRVESTSVTGRPTNTLGWLEVWFNSMTGRTFQRYTSSGLNPLTWRRVRSSGAWREWEPDGIYQGALTIGTDFNDVVTRTYQGVQSVVHPNQPVAELGTLEVMNVHVGRVLQRFTADKSSGPEVWSRIGADTGLNWGTWKKTPTQTDLDILEGKIDGGGGGAYTPIPRGPLEARTADITPSPSGNTVGAMSKDRAIVWTSVATTLKYSLDDGETWIDKHTFGGAAVESTLALDNGELLVTGSVGARSRRVVWVSEGLLTPDETWHEVLEAPYWGIKFTQTWSQATYGRIVLLNEYGPKAGTSWGSVDLIPEGEGATRVYLSMDYGRTWQVIFNLAEYVVDHHGRPNGDLQHLHGVEWDPYWDRIWVSWGDSLGGVGTNGIAYSDDLGATWETAYTSLDHTPSTQVVGIKAMPQCVLFFGDMGDDVSRIDRTEGKDGPYTLVPAFTALDDGKYLCQGHYQGQREGGDAPLLAAFATEGADGRDYLVATMDGYDFEVVWRNPDVIGGGRGLRHPVGPSIRGQFLAATNAVDGTVGNWAQLRIPATGY